MATISEDYVSFETAKILKEKGFDVPCIACWYIGSEVHKKFSDSPFNYNEVKSEFDWLSRPTLQMAMKWLREVHDIDVSIVPLRSHKEYLPRIECDITSHDAIPCKKYEEAAEVTIKYCLENLI